MIYRLSWCWMGLLSTVIFTVWLDLGADIFAWCEARANAGANVALTLSTDGCASPGDTRPRWWSCHRVACCSAVPSCLRSHPFIWSVWSETEDFKACHQCSSNLLGYDRYLGFITQRRSFVSIFASLCELLYSWCAFGSPIHLISVLSQYFCLRFFCLKIHEKIYDRGLRYVIIILILGNKLHSHLRKHMTQLSLSIKSLKFVLQKRSL